MNLLEETLEVLRNEGIHEDEITHVQDRMTDKVISFEGFKKLAQSFNYNSGYGLQEVNPYIEIVLHDGSYLCRREYDGSEWWEYCRLKEPYRKDNCENLSEFDIAYGELL